MFKKDKKLLYWEIKGQNFQDYRGTLTSFDSQASYAIQFVRFFVIHDLPVGAIRGGHAHRLAYQGFYMAQGSCTLSLSRGHNLVDVRISKKDSITVVPPLTFVEMRDFSEQSVLVVFTTQDYKEEEYIFQSELK